MRCFIDFNRTCTEEVHQAEAVRCAMWDPTLKRCMLVELAKAYAEGFVTYTTTFPDSAPPPKVNG